MSNSQDYFQFRKNATASFFFSISNRTQYEKIFERWDSVGPNPIEEGNQIADGWITLFSHGPHYLGMPPEWNRNPFTGEQWPVGQHWSTIDEFAHGDIKPVWEQSRFSFAYTLIRAYWRTGNETYVDLFWRLVENWKNANPPNQGPNWKCGQETAFRVMAWCFGLFGAMDAECTTPQRVFSLAQMLAFSGERIERNIKYALSQKNNHAISEAVGLFTIGILFPELDAAERWRERGYVLLERLARELIYEDGSFAQHSLNYHRLMLHDFIWAISLGHRNGVDFSEELLHRIASSAHLLHQLSDVATGSVPCYGQNDGALILPLNNCLHFDFRPVVQAAYYLTRHSRIYPPGPWDEDLLWLCGAEALQSSQTDEGVSEAYALKGGYFTLRARNGYTFVRCATFLHRPSQADMLQVDIRWRGQEVAIDPGTYSYNAPAPWDNALGHTAYHNTVTVDNQDQMDLIGRFLWLPWLTSSVKSTCRSESGKIAYWEGEHNGYRRLKRPVSHSRALVQVGDDHWIILDRLESKSSHHYRLHWLLADNPIEGNADGKLLLRLGNRSYVVQVGCFVGQLESSLVIGDRNSPRGWRCPTYLKRNPALSLAGSIEAKDVTFFTVFGPEIGGIELKEHQMLVSLPGVSSFLHLTSSAEEPIVSRILVKGAWEDSLETH